MEGLAIGSAHQPQTTDADIALLAPNTGLKTGIIGDVAFTKRFTVKFK